MGTACRSLQRHKNEAPGHALPFGAERVCTRLLSNVKFLKTSQKYDFNISPFHVLLSRFPPPRILL